MNSRLAMVDIPGGDAYASAPHAAPDERAGERLVALREDVLNDAEHAIGNLLQRMHHAARSARAEMGVHGERLQAALSDLERLLDLLFGYVSPLEVELRATAAEHVAESLAAHLRGQGVAVSVPAAPAMQVLADARALGRSFQLLAESRTWSGAIELGIACDPAGERIEFALRGGEVVAAGAHADLAAAVAGRLIDLQGGELRLQAAGGYAVTLPVAS